MTTYELNEMAKAGATIAELLEAAEVDMTEWEEDAYILFSFFNCGRWRTGLILPLRRNFHYTMSQHFCQAFCAKKMYKVFSQNLCNLTIAFFRSITYNR